MSFITHLTQAHARLTDQARRRAFDLGRRGSFCAACHGFDGRGGISDKSVTGKGYDTFEDAIRLGKGAHNYADRKKYMPSWSVSEISTDEVRLMALYIRGLN